jgi:DMSO/TMAO reductase YedYZ molybdopterin-dependent catalytic subunit
VNRAKLEPHQFFRRLPLAPHGMHDRLTRIEDAIVLCHLGVPRIAREDWSLAIDGLVLHPQTFTFADLMRFEKVTVTSVHQCAGSPLAPHEPTQRVCNVTWGGARLADILAQCAPLAAARFVWSTGADYGEFAGVSVDAYVKDLPIERVTSEVLVAYEMNGEPLAPEHGFPARLLVPGFYGTNSVKWLTRVTLAEARAGGPFTTRWYNDPVEDGGKGMPRRRRSGRSLRNPSSLRRLPTRVSPFPSRSRFGAGRGPMAELPKSTSASIAEIGSAPRSSRYPAAPGSASNSPGCRPSLELQLWLHARPARLANANL